MNELKLKKLREGAVVPQRATSGSAGLDLSACLEQPLAIPAGGRALIPTGIAIALPGPAYVPCSSRAAASACAAASC